MMFLRSDKSNPVSFGLFYFFKGQWISKHIFMEKTMCLLCNASKTRNNMSVFVKTSEPCGRTVSNHAVFLEWPIIWIWIFYCCNAICRTVMQMALISEWELTGHATFCLNPRKQTLTMTVLRSSEVSACRMLSSTYASLCMLKRL